MGAQPTRRDLLRWAAHGLAAVPLSAVVACANDSIDIASPAAGGQSDGSFAAPTTQPVAELARARTDGKW